jgi:hypothetical protein
MAAMLHMDVDEYLMAKCSWIGRALSTFLTATMKKQLTILMAALGVTITNAKAQYYNFDVTVPQDPSVRI